MSVKRCQVEPSNRDGLDELIGAWALDKFNWFIQAWEIFFCDPNGMGKSERTVDKDVYTHGACTSIAQLNIICI